MQWRAGGGLIIGDLPVAGAERDRRQLSPADVTIFEPLLGRISEVALWVSVSAPEKMRSYYAPASAVVPSAVIVVVQVMVTTWSSTVPRSVVPALAMVPVPPAWLAIHW